MPESARTPVAGLTSAGIRKSLPSGESDWCGAFEVTRVWQPPAGQSGVIVQRITRTFNVTDVKSGNPLSGNDLDKYVTGAGAKVNANELAYWEVFDYPNDSTDDWQLASLFPPPAVPGGESETKDTTTGTFTQQGSAWFFPDTTPADLGFTVRTAKNAGLLLSRYSQPTGGHFEDRDAHKYSATVSWDSTQPDEGVSQVALPPP